MGGVTCFTPPIVVVLRCMVFAVCSVAVVTPSDAAEGSWWERAREGNAGHYWIKTDLPPDETRELARHLNLMYDAMAERLGRLPQRRPERLNVLIFDKREDYLVTLMERYGVDARFTGGIFFVRGDESALAIWTENLPRQRVLNLLQHEAFHQFAFSRFAGNLPIWVNEGLAEFFGEAVLVGRNLIIGQTSERTLENVRTSIEEGTYIAFRDMVNVSHEQWRNAMAAGQGRVQYDQAWSMVQFLIYGENGRYRAAFERYLWLLNEGEPSERAFMQAFETNDVDAFEQRWIAYAREAKASSFVTALQRIEFLAEGALELSRRGQSPGSLSDLRDALREIEFTYTFSTHGMATVLEADDDELYVIPKDDLARQQPVFDVAPPRSRRPSRREQMLEEQQPTPPAIATQHLRPRGISVQWTRDRDDGTFTYEILVR